MTDKFITEEICDLHMKRIEERQEEFKVCLRDVSSEIRAFRECVSSKFNKLYMLMIGAMGATLLSVVAAMLREVFHGR
jgi:hypothetical protein